MESELHAPSQLTSRLRQPRLAVLSPRRLRCLDATAAIIVPNDIFSPWCAIMVQDTEQVHKVGGAPRSLGPG